ncbi:MAG TPA: hypothetical protein VE130_16465 [Nitrososphaeraceae archaeon]|nr:hypothetical protein [Nitrososphaeraceae archaeon]
MLINKFITLVVVITTMGIVALATTGLYLFTQNSCSSLGYSVCAQSDLSLPVPSENDIAAPGSQQHLGDQAREVDKAPKSVYEYADNRDTNDVYAFLLPFP